MADPLSVSASLMSLIMFAEILFGRTFKYAKAVRNAPEEIRKLSEEIRTLHGLLHQVQLLARELEGHPSQTSIQNYGLGSCLTTMEKIKSILDKFEAPTTGNRTLTTVKRGWGWPFSKSEANRLIDEIGRHKVTLGLALEADEISGLVRIMAKQAGLSDQLQEIKSELVQRREVETRIQLDEERQKILLSFGATTPERNHDMSLQLRQPDTGLWLTEGAQFRDWLATPGTGLWLYGIPGAGKTVLAASIIEKAVQRSSDRVAVAFYYCDYKDIETQSPRNILGALAKQIARQDEQSFTVLRTFYQQHHRADKPPAEYDASKLSALITKMAAYFETTMIIVDALDECGKATKTVTKLLAALRSSNEDTSIKTLFLSRDEVEIRDFLGDHPQVPIAARSSDLKLYVGAEMARRISDKELRIKDPSLKEHIMERLIEGADGMFRWVACQMDYLCELPNDAARRRALKTLPPTLNATYERILQRINDSNFDVQKLVQRSLYWLIHAPSLSVSELCEAVSVEPEHQRLDREAVPEEEDIRRHCSSLIRKSASGQHLELAHFTVREFLTSFKTRSNPNYCTYSIMPNDEDLGAAIVAKTYVRYLLFEDFDHFGKPNICLMGQTEYDYALWPRSATEWPVHARSHMDDPELLGLIQRLFHPSKSDNFLKWAYHYAGRHGFYPTELDYSASGSPLHFAASLGLGKVCTWLVQNGCGVNQNSLLGTPLHCAFWGFDLLYGHSPHSLAMRWKSPEEDRSIAATVHALLEVGADPSFPYQSEGSTWTPIYLAFGYNNEDACVDLLRRGATVNDKLYSDLPTLITRYRSFCKQVVNHVGPEHLQKTEYALLLGFAADPETLERPKVKGFPGHFAERLQITNGNSSLALRVAAYSGQLRVIQDIVQDLAIDINKKDDNSGSTALIESCMMDHVDVLQFLLDQGADPNVMDFEGRLALHYAVQAPGCECLPVLLIETANIDACDRDGNNIWHLAAEQVNIKALQMLKDHDRCSGGPPQVVKHECAALASLTEQIDNESIPLRDSCEDNGRLRENFEGLTPLHFAIYEGSPEAARLLVAAGADPLIKSEKYPSLLHFAVANRGTNRPVIVDMLIEMGIDPCGSGKSGSTPLHALMTLYTNDVWEDHLVLRTLAKGGANVNQPDGKGQTPLHLICGAGGNLIGSWQEAALDSLLDLSPDLFTKDQDGQTPIDVLIRSWEQEYIPNARTERATVSLKSCYCARLLSKIVGHCSSKDPNGMGAIPWSAKMLFLALWLKDDALSRSILDQNLDVHASTGSSGLSPAQGACLYGCSRSLLKRLLEASSFRSNPSPMGIELISLLCENTDEMNDGNLLELFSNGYDPNSRMSDGTTALMMAARAGKLSFVEILLRHGASVCAQDNCGWNAAHHACYHGRLKVMYALQKANIEWNNKVSSNIYTESGRLEAVKGNLSMLHLASSQSNSKVLEFLFTEHLVEDINGLTDANETALYIASLNGLHVNVGLLLEANADDIIFSHDDESPLHAAVREGHLLVVQTFLSQNCQTRIANAAGLTPELYALKYGYQQILGILKDSRAKEEACGTVTTVSNVNSGRDPMKASEPLKLAITVGSYELCRQLVEEKENIHAGFSGCSGCTPLLYALHLGRSDIAKYLLSHGATITGRTCQGSKTRGYTTFHYAAVRGDVEFMRELLDSKQDDISQHCRPIHPIHLAVLNNRIGCVKLLLENASGPRDRPTLHPCQETYDAFHVANTAIQHQSRMALWHVDSNIYSAWGYQNMAPLHFAASNGNVAIAKVILTYGASVDCTDAQYATPLHRACAQGRVGMVRLLLDSGANPNFLNNLMQSASMLAAYAGSLKSLEILVNAGADLGLQDVEGRTALHFAAQSGAIHTLGFFINLATKYNLEPLNIVGDPMLGELFRLFPLLVFNLVSSFSSGSSVYEPRAGNVLSLATYYSGTSVLKKLLRRIPREMTLGLLNKRHRSLGSPLHAAVLNRPENIGVLLDAGADPEFDGSEHGTPLMAACAIGRLSAVKHLIARGAKTSYIRDGELFGVMKSAKLHPLVLRWLLVGRYMEGRRLLACASDAQEG